MTARSGIKIDKKLLVTDSLHHTNEYVHKHIPCCQILTGWLKLEAFSPGYNQLEQHKLISGRGEVTLHWKQVGVNVEWQHATA